MSSAPPPWWDEGWTLSVARNWAEDGFIGLYNDGVPRSPGLAGHLPTISLAALGFKLFGIGVWQARLPFAVLTIITLAGLFFVARSLFDRKAAGTAVLLAILLPTYADLQVLTIGRQVLGEVPVLLCLLAGFICLHAGLERRWSWLVLACCAWALALFTKAQASPFLWFGLAAGFAAAAVKRDWPVAWKIAMTAAGVRLVYLAMLALPSWLGLQFGTGEQISSFNSLLDVTGLVLDWEVRRKAINDLILYAIPCIAGLVYAGWRIVKDYRSAQALPAVQAARIVLYGVVGSWLGWYALLAMGWPRYLFPPWFLGNIFIAAWLTGWFGGSRILPWIRGHLQNITHFVIRRRGREKVFPGLAALITAVVFLMSALTSLQQLALMLLARPPSDLAVVTEFLNRVTPASARIGSYDSELFFQLERTYIFPPDDASIQHIPRQEIGEGPPETYDPLADHLDYIVVGPFSEMWVVYDEALLTGLYGIKPRSPAL